jgi:hypothetical protein
MAKGHNVQEEETGFTHTATNPETAPDSNEIPGLSSLPVWARDKMSSRSNDSVPVRGRILKLKLGYNPNSSSVGSGVYVLPVILLGISTLFGAAAGIISSAFAHGRRKRTPRSPVESEQAGTE